MVEKLLQRSRCDFQKTHLKTFEMMDKLFSDIVVIHHHEKLFTTPSKLNVQCSL